jgi:hypothetical protein
VKDEVTNGVVSPKAWRQPSAAFTVTAVVSTSKSAAARGLRPVWRIPAMYRSGRALGPRAQNLKLRSALKLWSMALDANSPP